MLVDGGHGDNNLLHLIVEIKGYRREYAKIKKTTMDTYWIPGVNHLKKYGRVAGDSDFVPAAKLARREGIEFILDPLWQQVNADLFEHIDGLQSGLKKPGVVQ